MGIVTLAVNSMAMGNFHNPNVNYPWSSLSTEQSLGAYDKIFCKFEAVSSAYNNKLVSSVKFKFNATPGIYGTIISRIDFKSGYLLTAWNESTLTYNNAPPAHGTVITNSVDGGDYYQLVTVPVNVLSLNNVLAQGMMFVRNSGSGTNKFYAKGSNAPYLEISFSDNDNSRVIYGAAPQGGYCAKHSANVFTWATKLSGTSIVSPTVTSSKFRWRTSSSASATEIDCGTSLTYTMPANTVSADSFQWQAEVIDSLNNVSTTDWYTISTLEELSSCEIVEPKNIAIDGTKTTRFAWNHVIGTGTAQTKADLQYTTNNTTWNTLATVVGSNQYVDIDANTFPSGTITWRVRTYNTDNNAGSWATASITVIAAPTAPIVTAEQNPRPIITWQASGQQAYRIVIDGIFDSNPIFGVVNTYKLPIYLDDGAYTVKVSIQNEYGLWSDYGTAPISVSNVPGAAISISYSMGSSSVDILWESSGYSSYIVYRDGEPIAKTGSKKFTDLTAVGEHTYFVRGIYTASSNYGKSDELTINVTIDVLTVIDLETKKAVQLETTDTSFASISITESNIYAMTHITSNNYPLLEKSKYKEKNISFDCAFRRGDSKIAQFENLFAKDVCIKTPSGTSVVGNILERNRTENIFYTAFQCSVMQIAWDEVISID